jgi:hypothetical protein
VKQGEICSPVLFSMFIEELSANINQYGKHGIQLIPEFIQILILMFADDVILMSDTVLGLQNQLNILHRTSWELGLDVNLEKSNIIVFRNGGHLALNERWKYGNECIEVVNVYKYLGIIMSSKLSFSHTLNAMAANSKKGIICILKLLWSLGEKSPALFFKLFDAQIQPMLNYGAEIWGLQADLNIIEKIHLFALKRFLNVTIRTPNQLVYGETGRYPLRINIYVKCIKFWLRVLKLPTHRLPSKSYKMLLHLHEQNHQTWASSVCYFLHQYGFQDVWVNQGVGDEKKFILTLKDRLIRDFSQNWFENMQSNDRYALYASIKSHFSLSSFLVEVKHVQARNYLIRIRLGVSQLRTHKLRFAKNVSDESLLCPLCKIAVESEYHFILVCSAYNEIREMYISRKYYSNPNMCKLNILLASQIKPTMIGLAMYLKHAFDMRQAVLCSP